MAAVESGLPKAQQEPPEALRNVVDNNGAENVHKDELRVSSSECVVSIGEKFEQPSLDDVECSSAKLSIYRIPCYLKDRDDKAYGPQIVSLGPYHHGEEKLRPMDQHKLRCLDRILERYHHEKGRYLDSVKEVEQRARACYEGKISMSSDEFVEMMVLDGCFVLELFQGVAEGFQKLGYPCNDPIFSMQGSMVKVQIQRDMIMLENQIPLFILTRLLGLQLRDPEPKGLVAKLALRFFEPLANVSIDDDEVDDNEEPKPSFDQCGLHCLEVVWWSLVPLVPSGPKKTIGWLQSRERLVPSLTDLREIGIKIRLKIGAKSLGDILLKDGILYIPQLEIHEGTRSLFLNLIAFEQSHFDWGNHITSYVIFMQNLINSAEDVEYLYNHGIVDHCLGSNAEVVDLFNRLCQEVAFNRENSYLYNLSYDDLWDHILKSLSFRGVVARKWNSWRAILKKRYFDNPWSTISFIAAFVLLVLTFIQAFYAVYAYYRPRS